MSYVVRRGSGVRRDMDSVQLENIVTAQHGLGGSLARATIGGPHGPTMNTKCNRIYHVLAGHCTADVAGVRITAEAGDTILVPKGTEHSLVGEAEYLVINVPEFDPSTEVARP